MTIRIHLNTGSINNAIKKLQKAKNGIENGLKQGIKILTTDGAAVAQSAYGGMATATGDMISDNVGKIEATGGADGNVYIAEFGAGDATMPIMFEGYPGVDVYPGAFSKQVGSGEYAATGAWHFGGRRYTEVKPRAGLYLAKMYIEEEGTNIVKGAIKL